MKKGENISVAWGLEHEGERQAVEGVQDNLGHTAPLAVNANHGLQGNPNKPRHPLETLGIEEIFKNTCYIYFLSVKKTLWI